jgi:hypothetical protein
VHRARARIAGSRCVLPRKQTVAHTPDLRIPICLVWYTHAPTSFFLRQELGFLELVHDSFDVKRLPIDSLCEDAALLPLRAASDVARARAVHLYQLCRKPLAAGSG